MALGMKLGIGVAVVALGSGAGLWTWQHSKSANKPVDVVAVVPPAAPEVTLPTTASPAPEPTRSEPPPAPVMHVDTPAAAPSTENSVSVASPLPPPGVADTSERSFRAKPKPAVPETPHPEVAVETTPVPHADAPAATDSVVPSPAPTLPDATALAEKPKAVVAAPPASQPASSKGTQHVVQAGETYTSLAEKYLGNAKYANRIAKANPGKDPRRLFVGAKLNIPAAPKQEAASKDDPKAAASATSSKQVRVPAEPLPPVDPEHAYKVKTGESWNDLAQRFLGDSKRWPELYELNKDRTPKNHHGLRAGMVIELPAGVKPTTKPS